MEGKTEKLCEGRRQQRIPTASPHGHILGELGTLQAWGPLPKQSRKGSGSSHISPSLMAGLVLSSQYPLTFHSELYLLVL